MPRKMKLVIAGVLLALTALVSGLTMSVALNANAGNTATANTLLPAATFSDVTDVTTMMMDDTGTWPDQMMTMDMPEDFMSGPLPAIGTPAVQGSISTITGTKILLNKDSRTVNTNAQTKYGDASGDLTFGDLKVADRIFALGTVESDKSLTARWVLRLPALPSVERGSISSVDAANSQFKFKVGNNEWTATVSSSTVITKDGKTAALTDLAANDKVTVAGKADTTAKTIAAQRVVVGKVAAPRANVLRGTVKSVDATANTLVVTTKAQNNSTDVTVKVDGNTKYLGQNIKSLTDLKVGDTVGVAGQKQSDNSVLAAVITKLPANGNGNGGRGNNGAGPRGQGFPFDGQSN